MAKNSQGIGVTVSGDFGDLNIAELVAVSVDGVQADGVEVTPRTSTSRVKLFRPGDVDQGTASITFRGATLNDGLVGQTGTIEIYALSPGTASYWSGSMMIQSLAWQASVGELQEYRAVFKLGAA